MNSFFSFFLFAIFQYQESFADFAVGKRPSKNPTEKPTLDPTESPTAFPTSLKCSNNNPLSCLVIPILEHNCTYIKGHTEVCINDLNCFGIVISGLPSLYRSPTTIQIGIDNLETYCVGFIDVDPVGKKHHSSGSLSVLVNETNIVTDITIKKDSVTTFPVSALASYCSVSSMRVEVKASVSDQSADFGEQLSEIIRAALDVKLCSALKKFVKDDGTSLIQNTIDPLLFSLVENGIPSPIPTVYTTNASHYIHWSDSIVSEIHSLLSILSGDHSALDCFNNNNRSASKLVKYLFPQLITSDCILLDEETSVLEVFQESISSVAANITVLSVQVCGFRDLQEISLLEPSQDSNVTMKSLLAWQHLSIDLRLNVSRQHSYFEEVVVSMSLRNVSIISDLLLAVDSDLISGVHLDQLFLGGLDCFLVAVREISMPSLELVLGHSLQVSLEDVRGEGVELQSDVVDLVNNVFQLLLSGFADTVALTANAIFQGPIRSSVNVFLRQWMDSLVSNSTCPPHTDSQGNNSFIVWESSAVIQSVDRLVNEVLGGAKGLNQFLGCVTGGTGTVELYLSNLLVTISGLDSFYTLDILEPFTAYNLHNKIAAGFCSDSSCSNPLAISISKSSPGNNFVSTGKGITVSFDNISLDLDLLFKMTYSAIGDLQYGTLGTKGCFASAITTLSIDNLLLDLSSATLEMDDQKIFNITNIFKELFSSIASPKHLNKTNNDIATKLNSSELVCESGGVYPYSDDIIAVVDSSSDDYAWQWQIALVIITSCFALFGFLFLYYYWNRKIELIRDISGKNVENETSIVSNPNIPFWLKVCVPLVICINISIFLYSNYCPDAVSVKLQLLIGDFKTTEPKTIFNFGLGSTIQDMWDGAVYPLAILIAFFSGAWPYIKLLFMLFSWLAPTSYLSIASRSRYLQLLDTLGKWSLIDSFVMLLMLCAFYLNMYIGNELTVKVTVEPNVGFNLFLLGTMMSLGIGHIVLGCHRIIVEPKIKKRNGYSPSFESLSSFEYSIKVVDPLISEKSDKNETDPMLAPLIESENESNITFCNDEVFILVVSNFGYFLFLTCILVTFAFVILGTFLLTMGFQFKGLTGLILKDAATVDYSYVTIGLSAPEHSGNPSDFNMHWIQTSFFLFGLVMPIGSLAVLSFLWIVPRVLFVLLEVLNAWSALDVFCVAIAAGLLEIQQFAASIVGDSCDGINLILTKYLSPYLDGDNVCFDVIAYLKPNSAFVIIAAILLIVIVWPAIIICHAVVLHRIRLTHQEENINEIFVDTISEDDLPTPLPLTNSLSMINATISTPESQSRQNSVVNNEFDFSGAVNHYSDSDSAAGKASTNSEDSNNIGNSRDKTVVIVGESSETAVQRLMSIDQTGKISQAPNIEQDIAFNNFDDHVPEIEKIYCFTMNYKSCSWYIMWGLIKTNILEIKLNK